jgi:hypothetical protein
VIGAAADAGVGEIFVNDAGVVHLAGLRPFSFLSGHRGFPCVIQTFTGRILHSVCRFGEHGRERSDGLTMEIGPGCSFVDIDVGNGFGAEFLGELLSPLRGTGEANLFAVPTAD